MRQSLRTQPQLVSQRSSAAAVQHKLEDLRARLELVTRQVQTAALARVADDLRLICADLNAIREALKP